MKNRKLYLSVGATSPFEDNEEELTVSNLGVSAYADFGTVSRAPIGISLRPVTDSISPAANDFAKRTSGIVLGTSFTGREDLDLGIEIAPSRLDQPGVSDKFSANLVSFHLNYFFENAGHS